MLNKLHSMIGIGKKANYIVLGETGCIQTIKKKKCKLILLSSDASKNTTKRFEDLCSVNNIKYFKISDKESLGSSVGKGFISVMSITDMKFAKVIEKIIEDMERTNLNGGVYFD